jgi:two-component system response regulator AtoC
LLVLIGGERSVVSEYKNWIGGELPVRVNLCAEQGELHDNLNTSAVDLLIVDCQNSGFDVDQVLTTTRAQRPDIPIIIIPDGSATEDAISAFRLGASDYLVPPLDREVLLEAVRRHIARDTIPSRSSRKEGPKTVEQVAGKSLSDDVLFAGSAKTRALKQVVDKIIDTDLPVLITGESGTGKEMLARYLSHNTTRVGPFVKVNCAAIPSELLESELFGFEKGAFTGAYRRKPGKFEAANGGHLFLDEISELSYPLQSKLLHVLQDGTFSTLGSTREVNVDVRIIAATNHQLDDLVDQGRFRDDLYFRLNVVHLHIPPLRERLDQLGQLIDHFREKFAVQYSRPPVKFGLETQSLLFSYSWPGNIRELENVIRRATILGSEHFFNGEEADHFWSRVASPDDVGTDAPARDQVQEAPATPGEKSPPVISPNGGISLKEIAKTAALAAEREAIRKVLDQTRWNRKKTAEILDVSYKTLLTKIKETGLDNV